MKQRNKPQQPVNPTPSKQQPTNPQQQQREKPNVSQQGKKWHGGC